MAINLWTLGGKPSSYNPLPIGGSNLPINIGEYTLTLKAKSNLNATLTIDIDGSGLVNGMGFANNVLTREFQIYTFILKTTSFQTLFIADLNSKGDIIIENIQVVEKPLGLPKRILTPKVKVPKKNLFDGRLELGDIAWLGHNLVDSTRVRSVGFVPVKPNTVYQISHKGPSGQVNSYDALGNPVAWSNFNGYALDAAKSFTTPNNCYFIRFVVKGTTDINTQIQIEQGSTPTPYEPYKEILPPAKKGLLMDGINNYLQLPSMMMDSVEIDCVIDGVQASGSRYLFDARTGSPSGYIYGGGGSIGGDISKVFVDDIEISRSWTAITKDKRIKLSAKFTNPFTDDVVFFSSYANTERLKGILYGVKCYLNGQVVAEYDFTNPNNIVGDKVLQKAKNLIPIFDSGQWSFHPNFKVLGKDVGRLDATFSQQDSFVSIPVTNEKPYLYNLNTNGLVRLQKTSLKEFSGANQFLTNTAGTFTANETFNGYVTFRLTSPGTGSFDFIRPQLYELTGKEGTLYGSPVIELKAPKRVLYAKR
jgi:hypothetical protein